MRSTRIHILMLVAAALLVAPGSAVAQFDPPVGTNFDDASLQGWTTAAATATIDQPGPSNDLTDYFLRGNDSVSPPQSILRAPSSFYGNWDTALALGGTGGGCVEYDYKVFNDAVSGSPDICPSLVLQSNTADNTAIRAVFVCAVGKTVTETGGTADGWHNYVLPIRRSIAGQLPSNSFGHWVITNPSGGGASDWDTLLTSIQRVNFNTDIAGSTSQAESIGIDNFRVKVCSDFDDQTLQGWTVTDATATTDQPGPSTLLGTDYYLRGGDQSSSFESIVVAAPVHLGNWTDRLELTDTQGGCIEYDYIVWDDSVTGSSPGVCPSVTLKDNPTFGVGIRAAFSCAPSVTVTEPAGSNSGWHHFVLPLHTVPPLGTLPSNSFGSWGIPGSSDPIGDWNALMANVQRVSFSADIAGSSTQSEDFGIDNFCIESRCNWTADGPPIQTPTPMPSPTPVPLPCSGKKKLCVAKKMCGLLKCHEKAEKDGVALNGTCISTVEDKFEGEGPHKGCFENLEDRYGPECITFDDTAALEAKVDAFVADVIGELDPSFPTPIQNKCSAGKKKCVCKKASGLLKCHAKAEARDVDPATDPLIVACIEKVRRKFGGFCDGGANDHQTCLVDADCPGGTCEKGCFTKLEDKDANSSNPLNTCLTFNDAPAIEAKVDGFVVDVVCELDPGASFCGP